MKGRQSTMNVGRAMLTDIRRGTSAGRQADRLERIQADTLQTDRSTYGVNQRQESYWSISVIPALY